MFRKVSHRVCAAQNIVGAESSTLWAAGVIIVANRIPTVIDYDLVLALREGKSTRALDSPYRVYPIHACSCLSRSIDTYSGNALAHTLVHIHTHVGVIWNYTCTSHTSSLDPVCL